MYMLHFAWICVFKHFNTHAMTYSRIIVPPRDWLLVPSRTIALSVTYKRRMGLVSHVARPIYVPALIDLRIDLEHQQVTGM